MLCCLKKTFRDFKSGLTFENVVINKNPENLTLIVVANHFQYLHNIVQRIRRRLLNHRHQRLHQPLIVTVAVPRILPDVHQLHLGPVRQQLRVQRAQVIVVQIEPLDAGPILARRIIRIFAGKGIDVQVGQCRVIADVDLLECLQPTERSAANHLERGHVGQAEVFEGFEGWEDTEKNV